MQLFHEDGHLTDAGLAAITDEKLDDMQRLEAAEHLSFCDGCLLRYTNLLEKQTALLSPQKPLREPVLKRIRRRGVRILFNKYTTVAAAAVLVVALWQTGLFTAPVTRTAQPGATQSISLSARLNDAAEGLRNSVEGFFGGIFTGSPTSEATQKEKQRKEKEAVFDKRKKTAAAKPDDPTSTTPDTQGSGVNKQ